MKSGKANIIFRLIILILLPFGLFAQSGDNIEVELSEPTNIAWFNSLFQKDEDSIGYYAAELRVPQLPEEREKTRLAYQAKLSAFRAHLRNFVQRNADSENAAKALIMADFRNLEIDMDTLYSMAKWMTGPGLDNKYAIYLFQEIEGKKNDKTGNHFISFSMPDEKGKLISSADFMGKNVLVLFWASWCAPCRAEIPDLLSVYHQFRNKNFEVLAVSLDDRKDRWLRAIHQDHTDWHNLFDGKNWNTEVARNYAIHFIPQNLLIDKTGKIIAKDISATGLQKLLTRISLNQ